MSAHVVAWLDFRADDLARARDFIKAFQEDGVLDELGFLALMTRFSDVFHPATSTLMRSSRYLYFIAGIYRQLEREGLRASAIRAEARRRQDALREVLATNETLGVIGRDATFEIKQLPASVYWSGLRNLGIFAAGTSEATYQSSFDELRRQRRGYADDDKVAHGAMASVTWDPDLPHADFMDADGRVRPNTNFRLTVREATDLARRYQQRYPASLLSYLLRRELRDTPFPWVCGQPLEFLRPYLHHAQKLSLLARGTTLQYYQLVIDARDRQGWSTPGEIVGPAFARWWDEARGVLRGWRPEQLATLPQVADGLRSGRYPDIRFMSDWLQRMEASRSADALMGDSQARKHVRDREIAIKPLKSRLKHPKQLKQWDVKKVTESNYQLDYRHPVGSRFVSEILDGIARG